MSANSNQRTTRVKSLSITERSAPPQILDSAIDCVGEFLQDIGRLYKQSILCDTTLLVGPDEVPFKVHRSVLASRCEYFLRMFTLDMQESRMDVIRIPDKDASVFKVLLEYFYNASMSITHDNAMAVLRLADEYGVLRLKEKCITYVKELVNTENVFAVLEESRFHQFDELHKFCKAYIEQHAKIMFASDSFLRLSKETLIDLLESDKIQLPELELYLAVVSWGQNQIQSQFIGLINAVEAEQEQITAIIDDHSSDTSSTKSITPICTPMLSDGCIDSTQNTIDISGGQSDPFDSSAERKLSISERGVLADTLAASTSNTSLTLEHSPIATTSASTTSTTTTSTTPTTTTTTTTTTSHTTASSEATPKPLNTPRSASMPAAVTSASTSNATRAATNSQSNSTSTAQTSAASATTHSSTSTSTSSSLSSTPPSSSRSNSSPTAVSHSRTPTNHHHHHQSTSLTSTTVAAPAPAPVTTTTTPSGIIVVSNAANSTARTASASTSSPPVMAATPPVEEPPSRSALLNVAERVSTLTREDPRFGEALRSVLFDVLQHIRFPILNPHELYEYVEPTNIVPAELLLEAYRYHALGDRIVTALSNSPRMKIREGSLFYMPGVLENVPLKSLRGWTLAYHKPYSDKTAEKIFDLCRGTRILVGAKHKNSSALVLCAMGRIEKVRKETFENETVQENGVYWYHWKNNSFGFSDEDNINLGSADLADGTRRLSWHLTGRGGYRCGEIKNLNESDQWEKLVFWAP